MRFRPALRGDRPAIDDLLAERAAADGREPLTEYKVEARRTGPGLEVVAIENETVCGYALAARHGERDFGVEMLAHPASDERRVVAGLITQMLTTIPEGGSGYVWAWRTRDRAAAADLGLQVVRVLVQMERPLASADGVPPLPPAGVGWRRFETGRDEDAWLAANRQAFADHPETGAIDRPDLERRIAEPWFDSQGFVIAERAGEIVGYCWTKLHPEHVGEIYIIGVVPQVRGMGLGGALLDAGVADLYTRQGARRAMLYMDGTDDKLREFYNARGFVKTLEKVAFAFQAQPNR